MSSDPPYKCNKSCVNYNPAPDRAGFWNTNCKHFPEVLDRVRWMSLKNAPKECCHFKDEPNTLDAILGLVGGNDGY